MSDAAANFLFAQAAPVIQAAPETAAGLVGYVVAALALVCLTLIGLVVWIIRQQYTATIPAIQAEQKAQRESNDANQKAQRDSNEKNIAATLAAAAAEASAERKLCAEHLGVLNASLVSLTAAQAAQCQAIVAAVNQHTTEQASAYRHDLANTINEAVLGRELAAAKRLAEEKSKRGE